jgi:TonB family protein
LNYVYADYVKELSMRAPVATALLARLFGVMVVGVMVLGTMVFSPSFSLAQDQPEVARKIASRVVPEYPELARKMQITGTVRVEVTVGPNGKSKFTQVVGGSPVLAKAAVDAVEKWKWAPGPQETKELIELNFHP